MIHTYLVKVTSRSGVSEVATLEIRAHSASDALLQVHVNHGDARIIRIEAKEDERDTFEDVVFFQMAVRVAMEMSRNDSWLMHVRNPNSERETAYSSHWVGDEDVYSRAWQFVQDMKKARPS